nr:pyridoxamine 5'-phosphate oxidase family protein [Mesorhizobium shangrilense]
MHIRSLSTHECTRVLSANRLARLACCLDDRPYVIPIFYAYAENHLYAFSMPGKKIACMRANPHVALVIEEHARGREWKSVAVEGRYEELPDRIGSKAERDRAWSLLSRHCDWWEPGALKPDTPALSGHSDHVFYRITVDQLSGREAKED